MTIEEAQQLNIQFRKIDIRNRLHRINPSKYPKPSQSYTASQSLEVCLTIFNEKTKSLFDRDDMFYKFMRNK